MPAAIAAPPSRAIEVRDEDEAVGEAAVRPPQHEALLVGADGRPDDLRRDVEKILLELAHENDRPLDEARDLLEQALVVDEGQPLREGEGPRVLEDDRLAPVGVEDDLGFLERVDVVVEAAHVDRLRRHEAVAPGEFAGLDSVDRERHDLGGVMPVASVQRTPRRGRTQRRASGRVEALPQRIDFGQGKARTTAGTISASASLGRAARLLDHRDVELALLRVLLDLASSMRASPALFRKPWIAASGAPTRGPFRSSRKVGCAAGRPTTCSASRRGVTNACAPSYARLRVDERVGDEPLQVLRRLPLHAGGDFFGKEFEEQVGHMGQAF